MFRLILCSILSILLACCASSVPLNRAEYMQEPVYYDVSYTSLNDDESRIILGIYPDKVEVYISHTDLVFEGDSCSLSSFCFLTGLAIFADPAILTNEDLDARYGFGGRSISSGEATFYSSDRKIVTTLMFSDGKVQWFKLDQAGLLGRNFQGAVYRIDVE